MAKATGTLRPQDRGCILGALLALSVAAWAILIWQSTEMSDDMSLTMGLSAPLFIALWIVMMVAIMYPTASPMIMAFARIHSDRRARGQPFVSTWVFAGAYILLWSSTGLLAYGLAVGGDALAEESTWIMDNAGRFGGALLIAAGVYQLTPLKEICVSKCRTPMSFLMNSWREGLGGSLRMGIEHGGYCLGCCWLLFLILFPLGMMNVAVLALITVVIFAEKVFPLARRISYAAGIALIAYGAVVLFVPDALPVVMSDSSMTAMSDMDSPEPGGADSADTGNMNPADAGDMTPADAGMPMEQ
jgi:predicted metal-binding membrane protein